VLLLYYVLFQFDSQMLLTLHYWTLQTTYVESFV